MSDSSYILVTSARNEAAYITQTIRSVTAQTLAPQHWIIVSDGSTDETDEIVRGFVNQYPYIELLRVEPNVKRNYESKARAINTGYKKISGTEHAYVGILDADVSFGADYYQQIIERFKNDPRLGLSGGVLEDIVDGNPVRQITSSEWSVSGPVQMFRRECWRTIGGYSPFHEDAVAEVMARMNGWTVRAFPDLRVVHHRETGTGNSSVARHFFHLGLFDQQIGYHPLFFLAKAIRRFRLRPVMIGGLLMLCGYVWAVLSRKPKKVRDEIVRYLRHEQGQRLRARLGYEKKRRVDVKVKLWPAL